MLLVIRVDTRRMRGLFSFALSVALHGSALAWMALAPLVPPERPGSIYEREIRPNQHKIIWYNLSERLPDITPGKKDQRPARARERFHQTVVAGARDDQRPPQLVFTPAPEIREAQMLPAPNVVALAPPPKPVKAFHAPVEPAYIETPSPVLPDAPKLAATGVQSVPLPPVSRPQPRTFTPPPAAKAILAKSTLPAAPELTVAADRALKAESVLPPIAAARRTFTAPAAAAKVAVTQPAELPSAPQVETRTAAQSDVLQAVPMARALRSFAAPAKVAAAPIPAAALPDAPAVSVPQATQAAYAIVGLLPQREFKVPEPKASQKAGFSAGPAPRPEGAEANAEQAQLTVPGLFVQSATPPPDRPLMASIDSPTSRRNLAAAARAVTVAAGPGTSAAKRAPAPDARLEGRLVYAIAIQMPNVSSFSGSWMVWFAEREAGASRTGSDLAPPVPMRKVDPKYIPAAADEGVEGRVRLAAIIRRNGHVEKIELLQHLDSRLDASSQEALAKWEFTPASINGVPVDVDAVFEIPFRLSPKPGR
jgi:TonB family protein